MNICPNCGANIEGLTHHCDCCGTPLATETSFFTWHTFVTEASGDLYVFMRDLFQKLDEIDFSYCTNILQNLEINVFCYPESIIMEQKIRNRLYLLTTRKKARLTLVLNYDKYINSSRSEKKELLALELKLGLKRVEEKVPELEPEIDKCINAINEFV